MHVCLTSRGEGVDEREGAETSKAVFRSVPRVFDALVRVAGATPKVATKIVAFAVMVHLLRGNDEAKAALFRTRGAMAAITQAAGFDAPHRVPDLELRVLSVKVLCNMASVG